MYKIGKSEGHTTRQHEKVACPCSLNLCLTWEVIVILLRTPPSPVLSIKRSMRCLHIIPFLNERRFIPRTTNVIYEKTMGLPEQNRI